MLFLRLLACPLFIASLATSSRILLMCPFPATSHWLWIQHFARELVNRGHHITAITNHPNTLVHQNYTEIIIKPRIDRRAFFPIKDFFAMKYSNYVRNVLMWWKLGLITSDDALYEPKVKEIVESNDRKFDLVILEQFFHESFLMFGHKFQAPVVTIGTFGYSDNMDRAMGLITPWSFVPHIALPYKDRMDFWERCHNVLISLFDLIGRRWYYLPEQQRIAAKHFKGIEPLPSVLALERNISLMLINSHVSMDAPRPSMPGLVSVGGIHIKPVKPLPKNIQNFLDGAADGAVYFSLGTSVKSAQMPREKLYMILEAFKQIPQRVLWKYEDSSLGTLPKNVMISDWLPQNDILAHKNVVLFISHGGLFGTQEGIYRGVPFLFIPLYADQHRNTFKCVNEGYGEWIKFSDITTEVFLEKIRKIINNESYVENVRKASVIFRDNLVAPMDEAMYRIEYVIRHRGAPHMKSAAIDLPWYQYLLLDILLLYASVVLIPIFVLYKIVIFLANMVFRKNEDELFRKKMK